MIFAGEKSARRRHKSNNNRLELAFIAMEKLKSNKNNIRQLKKSLNCCKDESKSPKADEKIARSVGEAFMG